MVILLLCLKKVILLLCLNTLFCLILFKHFNPFQELSNALGTKLLKTLCRLYHRTFERQVGLGIELISIADDLLLERLWHVTDIHWQRQVLGLNLLTRDTCTCMTLTHEGAAFQLIVGMPFIQRTEHPCSYESVTDIGFGTKALDTGGVTPDDTDIMKHRGILQKIVIQLQFRMGLDDLVTAISHLTAVHKQYPPEFILRRIKLIYNLLIFHK